MLSVRWLIASSPLSTATMAAAISKCASSPMVPSLRVTTLQSAANTNFIIRGFGNGANNAGIEPSVGSVGDSYDNALAETINGLYKAELILWPGPLAGHRRR